MNLINYQTYPVNFDSSGNQHASKNAQKISNTVAISVEYRELWTYCIADQEISGIKQLVSLTNLFYGYSKYF
jgi:hypothetical protein